MTVAGPWERPCTTCDGSGRVISQAWLAWHAEYDRLERLSEVTVRLSALADHVRRAPQEPERATCPECGGDGVVVTEQGLALLDFLDRRFGVRPRTPRAETRSLPPAPPVGQSGAQPQGHPGDAWIGPVDHSALFAEAVADGRVRAITSGVPVPSRPGVASPFSGQAGEPTGSRGEVSQNHLPVVARAASLPEDLPYEGAEPATSGGWRPPPDLAGLPTVPPIPPDDTRPSGVPPSHGAQLHPRAVPTPPRDAGSPLGSRPPWRSDDTDH